MFLVAGFVVAGVVGVAGFGVVDHIRCLILPSLLEELFLVADIVVVVGRVVGRLVFQGGVSGISLELHLFLSLFC